ncbi:MAG TPA: hypothetical protein VFA96_02400 [Nocardioides sp.]|nr:hypothetical protein [Nocardioides sp.]
MISLAAAAAIALGLGMATTKPPKRQTLRVAAPAVDPARALDSYAAGVPNVVVKSAPVAVGRDEIAVLAVGPSESHDHLIRVVTFVSGEWQKVVDLQLPEPSFDFLTDAVDIGDVTADGRADFLIHVMAADNAPGLVVSDSSGTWRLVPLSPDPTDVYAERSPQLRGAQLVNQYNDCVPDCADGHTSDVAWRYSAAARHFTPIDDRLAIQRQTQGFFNAYNNILVTSFAASNPPPHMDASAQALGYAKASPDLTDRLKAFLSGQFDHDPVICAQNVSRDPVLVDTVAVHGDSATAVLHQGFGSGTSNVRVTLTKRLDLWQLDAVECL